MTSGRSRSARGPGVLLVAATGAAAAAVALDAGFVLPAPLRVLLFAGWAVAVGVLCWCTLGRRQRDGEAVVAGGLAVAAFGLVVACVPGGSRVGRLAPPWASDPPPARLTVTTGDPVVARGAGVTLACVADQRTSDPATVRLDVRTADGSVRPHHAAEELPGVFAARLAAVADPLEYRFAAGPAATAWHRVTPADPVAVTPASGFVSTPPTYSTGQYPVRRSGLHQPVTCLTGGRVTASVEFDRPATDVRAVWQPDDDAPAQNLPVELAASRRGATFAATVTAPGRFELTLAGDHGFRSAARVPVAVVRDQPPAFVAVTGIEAGRWKVGHGRPVELSVEVSDDVWAAPPTLALLAGPTPESATATAVPLTATGGGWFTVRLTVPPADGPTNLRLRLTDGAASCVHFPPDGWAAFDPTEHAPPLAEQLVATQRDRVAARIAAANAAVARQGGNEVAAAQLLTAAGEVGHVVELEPLAARLRATAGRLRSRAGAVEPDPLAELGELNRRTAAERLDRIRLGELAIEVRALANGRPTPTDLNRVRDRLSAVVAASPRLTAARAAADAQALTDAAAAAVRLADQLEAASATLGEARAGRTRPLAARLDGLTARVDAATANGVVRLGRPVTQLAVAARSLNDGWPADALPPLEQAGRELATAADTLARLADARRDVREAARQLAGWQAVLDAGDAADKARFDAAVAELLVVTAKSRPSGCDTPERISREYPAPDECRRQVTGELKGYPERLISADPRSELNALAARLADLPPAAESVRSRLALAAARRAVAAADARPGVAEILWRLDLFVRELAGEVHPAELGGSPDRLAAFAVRVGLPPDLTDSPEPFREAVRAQIAGELSDLDRVRLIARWWATRTAVGPDQWRQLGELLGTVLGDEPTLSAAVRLCTAGGRAAEGQAALDRLVEVFARQPERRSPLAACGPNPPTAAERLIHLDTGERLAGHRAASKFRMFAAEVGAFARQVAAASADAERADAAAARHADYPQSVARIRAASDQPPSRPEVSELLAGVEAKLASSRGASDRWAAAAAELRLLPCLWDVAPRTDRLAARLGRLLGDADAKLAPGAMTPESDEATEEPGRRLAEVAKLVEAASR